MNDKEYACREAGLPSGFAYAVRDGSLADMMQDAREIRAALETGYSPAPARVAPLGSAEAVITQDYAGMSPAARDLGERLDQASGAGGWTRIY